LWNVFHKIFGGDDEKEPEQFTTKDQLNNKFLTKCINLKILREDCRKAKISIKGIFERYMNFGEKLYKSQFMIAMLSLQDGGIDKNGHDIQNGEDETPAIMFLQALGNQIG